MLFGERARQAGRLVTAPCPLAPDQLDRTTEAGHVDQPDVTAAVAVNHHAARQAAHHLRRGLDHHPQPRLGPGDLDHVETIQTDQQVAGLAVGGISTWARASTRRRLGHRRGLPDGQLGRYRSWEAPTSFTPTASPRVAHTPTSSRQSHFAATREHYEQNVRGGLEALLDQLRGDEFGDELKSFRQQRDVRFSPDNSPYKTTTYGVLHDGRDGFYAQLSSTGLYAGTGGYMLAPDQLQRMRAAIDDEGSGPALARAIRDAESAGLEIEGRR